MSHSLLRPFVRLSVCVKCGSRQVVRQYHATNECKHGCGSMLSRVWIDPEHHLLTCQGCGYQWRERPKDRQP
mgnify:CR=1 FL=1